MAQKIDLVNGINTIDDGGANTALEVRTLHTLELGNSYGTSIYEDDISTNTITTKNSGNLNLKYTANIVKQGRLVTIKGTITNNSTTLVSNEVGNYFFEITNPEYLPDPTSNSTIFRIYGNNFVRFEGAGAVKLYCKVIPAGETWSYNIFYYTIN